MKRLSLELQDLKAFHIVSRDRGRLYTSTSLKTGGYPQKWHKMTTKEGTPSTTNGVYIPAACISEKDRGRKFSSVSDIYGIMKDGKSNGKDFYAIREESIPAVKPEFATMANGTTIITNEPSPAMTTYTLEAVTY